ncbi:MAG: hypothetical protein ACP5IM_05770 [Candidatus Bathyarchaeia archaeon]|nr:MAG: hypothetical protein C0193_02445 [Candidatus Bathyarchaeota archaeon]
MKPKEAKKVYLFSQPANQEEYLLLAQLRERLIELHRRRFKALTGQELQLETEQAPPSMAQEKQPQTQEEPKAEALYGQLKFEKRKISVEMS